MCLTGAGAVARAACRGERAADRGLSFLDGQGISPSNEGRQDGIEPAAFFGQEVFMNPRRLPRRHFLQHPKANHFFSLAASSGLDKPSEDWISPYLRTLRKH
jgi:hypothetical protein